MKWMQMGRAALLGAVCMSLSAGLVSCTNTKLGYLFVTSALNGGQIYSYRVDSESGTLSQLSDKSTTQNSPTSTAGANPTRIALAGGGVFIYVLNTSSATPSIALFTVGGDGTVFYQSSYFSQGQVPQDIRVSSNGDFLLVADKYQPGLDIATCETVAGTSNACDGDITVFSIDQSTGKLSVVQNTTPPSGGTTDTTFFPVGENPVRLYAAGNYVYTLDNSGNGNSRIFVYQIATSGLLSLTETGGSSGAVVGPSPVAVNGTGSTVYVADSIQNVLYEYSIGSQGNLVPLVNTGLSTTTSCGETPNGTSYVSLGCDTNTTVAPVTGPTSLAIDGTGKFLYVAASGTNNLVGYTILASGTNVGALQPNVTYSSGAAPQCIVITNGREFLYTSNYADGSVSGIQVDADTGQLKDATNNVRTAGEATCLVYLPYS